MKFVFACVVCIFLLPLFVFAAADVVINEIAWMGSPPKAGESASVASNNEWIELYNTGSEAVDLGGWMFAAADEQPNITLSGTISAGGYFLLERTNDETVPGVAADLIYTGALSNSGEKLELKNVAGTIIDSVDAMSGWPAGDNNTKETMQRTSAGGWITAAMTPASPNANQGGSQAPTSDVEEPGRGRAGNTSDVGANSGVAIQPAVIQEPKKLFTVDAGENIKTVAGAEVHFQGTAFGENGAPLSDTGHMRYLWNFGDGAFFEGKNTNHIYRYSGMYRAVLYINSGEMSGSDVVEVRVEESEVTISEMAGAWIELVNEGVVTVDMSSWQIRSDTSAYAIPARTLIGSGAFVVFPQETTGLLFGALNPKAELRYANGMLADALSFGGTLLPEKSIMRDDEGNVMMGEQTPGKENKNHESGIILARQSVGDGGNQGEKEKNYIQQAMPIVKQEKKQAMIHDSSFMIQPEEMLKTELPQKKEVLLSSLFSSNYFWLAASISIGLIAGAVVLALRAVVLF